MPLHLSADFFIKQRQLSGWFEQNLAVDGINRFTTARISPDIQITRSHCNFTDSCQCCIEHPAPTTLVLYGISGICQFSTENHQCTVRPGDLWVMQTAEEPLQRLTPANQICAMQVVKCSTQRLYDTAIPALIPPFRLCRIARQSQPPVGFQRLFNNPLSTAIDKLMAESQALELLAHSLNLMQAEAPPQPPAGASDTLHLATELLTADLCSPPSLEALAKATGMSHVRLNREFKLYFGNTVFGWLRQHRMSLARHQLRHSRREITEIALQLGYSSASHFSSSFRQHNGCTPLQYRINAA